MADTRPSRQDNRWQVVRHLGGPRGGLRRGNGGGGGRRIGRGDRLAHGFIVGAGTKLVAGGFEVNS